MKPVIFVVGVMSLVLIGCSQSEEMSAREDDVFIAEGSIIGTDERQSEHVSTAPPSEETGGRSHLTAFYLDMDRPLYIQMNDQTEVYVKHTEDYLRVNQDYVKPYQNILVYGKLAEVGDEKVDATVIVVLAEETVVTGEVSWIADDGRAFQVKGEDGQTQFVMDVATEVLKEGEEDPEPSSIAEVSVGTMIEVSPRRDTEQLQVENSEAASVKILEPVASEQVHYAEENLEEDLDEQLEDVFVD